MGRACCLVLLVALGSCSGGRTVASESSSPAPSPIASASASVAPSAAASASAAASTPVVPSSPAPVSSPVPASSGAGSTVPAGSATITGTVTAGPVCPVERNPPDLACAPRPVEGATIIAIGAGGARVAEATSSANGSYRLVLARPGTVTVSALPVKGLMRQPAPVTITIAGGETRTVDLQYDTGIR